MSSLPIWTRPSQLLLLGRGLLTQCADLRAAPCRCARRPPGQWASPLEESVGRRILGDRRWISRAGGYLSRNKLLRRGQRDMDWRYSRRDECLNAVDSALRWERHLSLGQCEGKCDVCTATGVLGRCEKKIADAIHSPNCARNDLCVVDREATTDARS